MITIRKKKGNSNNRLTWNQVKDKPGVYKVYNVEGQLLEHERLVVGGLPDPSNKKHLSRLRFMIDTRGIVDGNTGEIYPVRQGRDIYDNPFTYAKVTCETIEIDADALAKLEDDAEYF